MKVTKAKSNPGTQKKWGAVPRRRIRRYMVDLGNALVLGGTAVHRFKCVSYLNLCDAKDQSCGGMPPYSRTVVFFEEHVGTEEAIKNLRRVIAALEDGPKLRPPDFDDDEDFDCPW